ncbi:MAG: glycosyltransferase family 2 protein [Candidatus Jordarchaeales archaeon]
MVDVSIVVPTHNRREKLVRLLSSIFECEFTGTFEVIVVDDASTDGTCEEVRRLFPTVRVVRSERELYVAGSRNLGIRNANGKYVFLVDDDNIIDRDCISELFRVLERDAGFRIGVVAPIMYYYGRPDRVWCAGVVRSMTTSLTRFVGRDIAIKGKLDSLIVSSDFPNCFMVRREVIEKVGFFDEKNFPVHYEEADFGERVRGAGFRLVCNPRAKVWHDLPLPEEVNDKARLLHVHSELRAYYAARNRMIFHRKYSKKWQLLFFISLFNWFFTLYYLMIILWSKRPVMERLKTAKAYLKGILDGLTTKV